MATRLFLSKSKLISKFSKEPSSRAFSVLKEQHNNIVKKLVVSREHQGSPFISLLSIGDNNDNPANYSPRYPFYYPAASCNNILLLRGSCLTVGCCIPTAVWNPTTGAVKALPAQPETYPFCGIGFDPKSKDYNDYKVIWVADVSSTYKPYWDQDFQVELYSLKTDSWKRFTRPPKHVARIQGPTLFINGFYYWPVYYSGKPDSCYAILAFDFANEDFCSPNIHLPDTYMLRDDGSSSSNFIIAEFEGSLAVVAYSLADELADDDDHHGGNKPFEFEIWVWNVDESLSWSRRGEWAFTLPAGTSDAGVERPLGLFNNDQLYLRDFMGELVLFDCATGQLKKKNLGFKSNQMGYSDMSIFAYVVSSAEEEVKFTRKKKRKLKIGKTLSNSTTFTSKLAPILNDDSKPNPNNNNKPKLLLGHSYQETIYLSQISQTNNNDNVLFNFPRFGAYFYPAASCNSALLLCYIDSDCRAALWNPTTDEVKKLPDQLSPPSRICDVVWYGFGFDPKADEADYKVIRCNRKTIRNGNTIDQNMQLYSLKADSWKDLATSFSCYDLPRKSSLFINGFCYWIVSGLKNNYIASFDFANEIFSTPATCIPLPPPNYYSKETRFHNLLVEFHGSLAALVFVSQYNKPFEEFEIWVWNSDEWRRESVVHVPVGAEKPLGLFANDQLYLQGFIGGEVLLFDCTKGGELQRLGLNARGPQLGSTSWENHDYIFPYVERSFPLNGKKIIRASHKIIND